MPHPPEDDLSFYLKLSREMRERAERASDPDVRAAELEIADRYEWLANQILRIRSEARQGRAAGKARDHENLLTRNLSRRKGK